MIGTAAEYSQVELGGDLLVQDFARVGGDYIMRKHFPLFG